MTQLCNRVSLGGIYGLELKFLMGSLAKCLVMLAGISVLVVLISPAPDELPCTSGHRPPLSVASLTNLMAAHVHPSSPPYRFAPPAGQCFGAADVLALICSLLC